MNARQAMSSSRTSSSDSIEQLADSAEHTLQALRERVVPGARRWASQAEDMAYRGVDAMRDQSEQLRERARFATDRSLQYVKDQPVKAALIAVAAGALLAMLLRASRSTSGSSRHRYPG